MRGYPKWGSSDEEYLRSIPADAGLPAPRLRFVLQAGVYPRGCGATCQACLPGPPKRGLSPRMRGYLRRATRIDRPPRSIPADAGLPAPHGAGAGRREVYPRGCGATTEIMQENSSGRGLSPRMRGYRTSSSVLPSTPGSIPADAGLPPSRDAPQCQNRVYPRGCGATGYRTSRSTATLGLSPRMRGYRPPPPGPLLIEGSIPADAGLPWRKQ